MDVTGQADRIRQFWDGYAADYDAEPDHGLRGPGMRRAWRDLLSEALPPAPAHVAEMAGVNRSFIYDILRGRSARPSIDRLADTWMRSFCAA